MGDKSAIEWTDATWNVITGCSVISRGCDNCYAMRDAAGRLKNKPGYVGLTNRHRKWNGKVRLNEHLLDQPLRWRRPRRIFVNSMGDLFHENVPDEWIDRVFAVMALAPQHRFQYLTKRADRMAVYMQNGAHDRIAALLYDEIQGDIGHREPEDVAARLTWPLPNVWCGTSVEDRDRLPRIDELRATPAAVRFLSLEPLLEGLGELDLTGIHWCIVGGESGPNARPMHPQWARDIRDQCEAAGVAFHFKQWGEWVPETQNIHALSDRTAETALYVGMDGRTRPAARGARMDAATVQKVGKKRAGRLLDGRAHDGMPS